MTDVRLYLGDCLDVMRSLQDQSVDGVFADPPYSSGGAFRGDRMLSTREKYINPEDRDKHADFTGDNRDQRSYLYWSALWLSEALRVSKPGAVLCLFTDWRQLPTTTDALQCGGWVWRGIVPWNKTEAARPQKGRFRQQCKYIVWGTNGPAKAQTDECLPGFFTYVTLSAANGKRHIAEKPLELMQSLLRVIRPGGIVLDPFMGSGTTGEGCVKTGRGFVGIELDPIHFATAQRRLSDTQAQPLLRGLMV